MKQYFIDGKIVYITEIDHLQEFVSEEIFEAILDLFSAEVTGPIEELEEQIEELESKLDKAEEEYDELQDERDELYQQLEDVREFF